MGKNRYFFKKIDRTKIVLSLILGLAMSLLITIDTSYANPVGDTVLLDLVFEPFTTSSHVTVMNGYEFWAMEPSGPGSMDVDIGDGIVDVAVFEIPSNNFSLKISDMDWLDENGQEIPGEINNVECTGQDQDGNDVIPDSIIWTKDSITIQTESTPSGDFKYFCEFTVQHLSSLILPEANGGDGYIPFGPTMGRDHFTGNKIVTGGFGIDGDLVDVEGWYTPHGWDREPGPHTFTMKIYSELGLQSLTEVHLLTSIIKTWDANNPIWKITLVKNFTTGKWDTTIEDKQNLIGNTIVTSFELDNRFAFFSITINDMEPTPENIAIGVRMLDNIFGMSTAWFNEGLRIKDTFAYPNMENGFEEKLSTPSVCTEQEDPKNRYTCAFEEKRQAELSKAEKILNKITSTEEIDEWAIAYDVADYPESNPYLDFSALKIPKVYLNFDSLKQ